LKYIAGLPSEKKRAPSFGMETVAAPFDTFEPRQRRAAARASRRRVDSIPLHFSGQFAVVGFGAGRPAARVGVARAERGILFANPNVYKTVRARGGLMMMLCLRCLDAPDANRRKKDMPKLVPCGGRTLLALAVVLLAAATAFAQDSNNTSRQTPDAQNVSAGGGAKPEGPAQKNRQRRAPLTAEEKINHSLHSAFLSPSSYLGAALDATITQWREQDNPNKTTGDRVADWGSRFARDFATSSTKKVFASGIYPALLHQDPRYEPSGQKGFARRTLYAASRVLVTRGDDGRPQPNYSRLAGDMTASALANLWERSTPGHDRIGTGPTFTRFGTMLAVDALTNVAFREFGPDLKKIFRH
jgi:hypothetical protein